MRNIFFLVSILSGTANLAQQQEPEAREVLDAMSTKYKRIDVFTADFEQVLKNKAAGVEEDPIKGIITVMGDKYLLELFGQQIYNDTDSVYTYAPDIAEVTIAAYEPDEEEISLSNIYDLYKSGFKYHIQDIQGDGTKLIDLEPIEKTNKSYFKIRMEISKDHDLNAFSVYEGNGNIYTYQVTSFKERTDIPASFFTFDPSQYDDIEVVRF